MITLTNTDHAYRPHDPEKTHTQLLTPSLMTVVLPTYKIFARYPPSRSRPYCRDLRYSSNDGATEMDLRGSSWSTGSGSRVSAIPPLPTCFWRDSKNDRYGAYATKVIGGTKAGCVSTGWCGWLGLFQHGRVVHNPTTAVIASGV